MQKVLLAIDGSRYSDKALKYVKDMMRENSNIEVTILSVLEVPNNINSFNNAEMTPATFESSANESAKRLLSSAGEFFKMDGLEVKTISKFGHPATVICEYAQYAGYDLIAVGSRGLGTLKGLFMGSVSSKVAHMAHCPVLIIK